MLVVWDFLSSLYSKNAFNQITKQHFLQIRHHSKFDSQDVSFCTQYANANRKTKNLQIEFLYLCVIEHVQQSESIFPTVQN